jgi:sterol desaturase/sphingolipid hydroxylase (fatty acid hydroxylase superfamily)
VFTQFEQSVFVVYCISLMLIALWETFSVGTPARTVPGGRWSANFLLGLGRVLCERLLVPVTAVAAATTAWNSSWGALAFLESPIWLGVVLGFVAIDALRWSVHRLEHASGWLWRLHRVHHMDPDVDFTTGWRQHPLETVLLLPLIIGGIVLLGLPPEAVMAYELALAWNTFFAHADVDIPAGIDRQLRRFLITPSYHRIHHSSRQRETNSNFGVLFPFWDRLAGTEQELHAHHIGLPSFGLDEFRDAKHLRIGWLLVNPLLSNSHESRPVRPDGARVL